MRVSAHAIGKGAIFTGRVAARLLIGTAGVALVGAGCLSRPVTHQEPTTKTNFTASVNQAAVDKVDLLFAIDNSASMGDKQDLLKAAVPDLIGRLVTPNCLNNDGTPVMTGGKILTTADGNCTMGKAEFQPVHDLHIGIVSSSLGGNGGDQCDPNATNPVTMTLNRHNNDHGHLLNRGGDDEHAVADAGTSNYLAWFPTISKNMSHPQPTGAPAIVGPDPTKLISDFQDMVQGVHEYGCGLENQMEAWYHFLIQPDPYLQIIPDPANGNRRIYDGVDKDILVQRHDFLRPDSLVAIIVLTDEEDSGMDPLAVGGQGWAYINSKFPGSCGGAPARATSACDKPTTITSPNCTSCGFAFDGAGNPVKLADGSGFIKDDPNCQKMGDTCTDASGKQAPQPGYYTSTEDVLNTRTIRMKQRYGVDPQYPIQRYTDGLGGTNGATLNVPNSKSEHAGNGVYLTDAKNCRNPLFAASLPTDPTAELCNLPAGPRTPSLVFFAAITGVPWQMLTEKPTDPGSAFKTSFSRDDWKLIIGNDPNKYDQTGVDPHMYEAITPNYADPNGGPSRASIPPPTAMDTADPYNGREWDSQQSDLQFACTFALPATKDCSLPQFASACDCGPGKNPPLCVAGDSTKARVQDRGKAYPGIRQLTVVRDLGDQGIVASLCARKTDMASQANGDPNYGYRPAVVALVDRLKNALASQCLPQQLTPSNCGDVPCLILEVLPAAAAGVDPESLCNAAGLSVPDPLVLSKFRDSQKAAQGTVGADAGPGVDKTNNPVCQVQQLVPGNLKGIPGSCMSSAASNHIKYSADFASGSSCGASADPGWCYLGTGAAGSCPQSILFSGAVSQPTGASFNLVCIESSGGAATDAGK